MCLPTCACVIVWAYSIQGPDGTRDVVSVVTMSMETVRYEANGWVNRLLFSIDVWTGTAP